jgi:translation initiation factor IF-1
MSSAAKEVTGVVKETLPQGLYRVHAEKGEILTVSLSGVPKQTIVRVIPGDRVIVEVSPVDPSRGRIKARLP